ncbi:MAG: hypothetical protein KVP17_001187 [Porospora cf. gigantea B]|nr:MAG: hypothetical protein KVP17_001187 [Porospora cf. gigantea B]
MSSRFVILSGGMLYPHHRDFELHMMGLYCRLDWIPAFLTRTWDTEFFDYDNSTLVRTDHSVWSVEEQAVDTIDLNSDTAVGGRLGLVRPNASCQNDLLKMEFRVLWETLKVVRAPNIRPVFNHDLGKETIFDIRHTSVVMDVVTPKDTMTFSAAVGINLFVAVVMGWVLCTGLHTNVGQILYL